MHKTSSLNRSCLSALTLIWAVVFMMSSLNNVFSQQTPQIPEQLKRMYQVIGNYEGEATIKVGGQTFTSKLSH
jgi:hypothetical protein